MIVGEIDEVTKKVSLEFIQVDEKEFIEVEVDITDILSEEELIEKINELELEENKYIKIILVGRRKIEIHINIILKNLLNNNIIKIKDKTILDINLEDLAKQSNLKGIFVRKLLEKKIKEPEKEEKIQKAIEIGLEAFD